MTPESLLREVIKFARETRVAFRAGPYSRSSRNTRGAHLYNAYRFEFKGYQVFYADRRVNDNHSNWVIDLKIHTSWGKVRARADFDADVENARWINTQPDVLMLYKLSRD